MQQLMVLKNKGLETSPNELSSVPEGALIQADNCSIDVDNIIEYRRGNSRYVQFNSAGDRARRYAVYKSTLIAAYSNGKLAQYSAGSWTNYSGTYNDPDTSLARLRFLLAQQNLYFTTSGGVYRLDAPSGTPALSGVPKGLDTQLALHASSGSAVATGNQVAYRHIWAFKDANNTLYTGSPSGRSTIVNASGSTKDIDVTITIPSGITTSFFLQVYRSVESGGATVEPNDELQLVYENYPVASDISNGYISFTDTVPMTLLGTALYTNPSQQTILQANERPPLADYLGFFANCTFFAKCVSKQRLHLTIISASTISYGDTLVIDGTTYTAKGTETIASGFYSLSKVSSPTATLDGSTNLLTAVSDTSGCKIGRQVTGSHIPAGSYVGAFTANTITLTTSDGVTASNTTGASTVTETITVTPNTVAFGTTATTPAQDIAATADSLIRVINRYATNTLVSASLLSGYQDLPGKILIEERGVGGGTFYVTASSGLTAFNPVLSTSGTSVASSNDNFVHQLFYSKTNQPESVPLLNYQFVGSGNNKILGILALRAALYIFKDKEGIYRLTGTDPTNFQIDLLDSSAHLLAPDSLAIVNNQIWCLSDQGVTTVTDTGVTVISRPIEDKVLTQMGTALTALKNYSFGVGYETDRKYILWTVSGSADTFATQAFVFNTFTKAFVRWPINASAAIVSPDDTKLYIGDGATSWTTQERKNLDYTDFVDYSIAVTISAFSGNTVTVASATGLSVGDVLTQGSVFSVIKSITGNVLTLYITSSSWTLAAASVLKSYLATIEYAAVSGGNPGTSKQWPELSVLFRSASFNSAQVGFATDVAGDFEYVTIQGAAQGSWGLFGWGQSPWGGAGVSQPIRTLTPLEKQRASLLRIQFIIQEGYAKWRINGISLPFTETHSYQIAKAIIFCLMVNQCISAVFT